MNLLGPCGSLLAATTLAVAQCELQPTGTGRGLPSLDDAAGRIVEWDPDGQGPLGPHLVVSGVFTLAGDLPANRIAMFDPATDQWSPLGEIEGLVQAFVVLPNGLLLAGGQFASPSPNGSTLKVWTGSAWSAAIPQPPGNGVLALAVAPNGDLVVSSGTGTPWSVHRLGPNGWQPFGTATGSSFPGFAVVRDLAFASNGDLLVAGVFGAVDGVVANNVARWDGSTWSALGSGVDGSVRDLLLTSTGDLYVGGLFTTGSPAQNANIARWNGTSWQALGGGTQGVLPYAAEVYALLEVPGGVVAGGQFEAAGGTPAYKVAQWNGTNWSAMGGGIEQYGPNGEPSFVVSLQRASNGEIFATGTFATISGRDGQGMARWNGTDWRPLRPVGIGAPTTVVHRTANGDVYLGGPFRDIDGVVCNGIARRVFNGWQPLGSGIGIGPFGVGPAVAAIASLPNGDIVVGGQFPSAGDVAAQGIARWNGVAWAPLGSGLSWSLGGPLVEALHVDGNGDLWVAGSFDSAGGIAVEGLARWNGSQWSAVGSGLATGPGQSVFVEAVTTSAVGDLYVSGSFAFGGPSPFGKIAVSTAGSWQLLGTTNARVEELRVLPNGDLLAAGAFQAIDGVATGCVARWSNGVWSSVGALGSLPNFGSVESLIELPGGDLLAGGFFFSSQNGAFHTFARFDGVAWTLFDAGTHVALDLAVDSNGEVLVAGNMRSSGGVASANFLRLVPPCPASAIASVAGCAGSGGSNVLAATAPPWLGTIFVANASGLPTNSVGMTVLGLGTLSLPLPSLLPQGVAGCELLVTPDVLGLVVPSGGQALLPIALPLVPALVGGVLHLQVVPIEFTIGGAISSVTSTNRLSLVLGVF